MVVLASFAIALGTLASHQSFSLFISYPSSFIHAMILASCTAFPLCCFLWLLDRNEPEPPTNLIFAFLWGAFVATSLSLFFNDLFKESAHLFLSAELVEDLAISLSAPFIEELTKGIAIGLLFVLARHHFDNALDGIVYGATIGVGFAWFENILYYMASVGNQPMLFDTFIVRGLLGAGNHAVYTALIGIGFGLVRQKTARTVPILVIILFWLAGIFTHILWNTYLKSIAFFFFGSEYSLAGIFVATIILQIPFVIFLLSIVVRMWRFEENIIRKYLEDEEDDIINSEELLLLTPTWKRSKRNLSLFFHMPTRTWIHHYRIRRACIDLAFVKWHRTKDPYVDWPVPYNKILVHLRTSIRELRTSL